MTTAIGIVTYGNHQFTALALRELKMQGCVMENVLVVVGKPGDLETIHVAEDAGADTILHNVNKGFPGSINDLYDYCCTDSEEPYENLIIMGNDVVPYPGAIRALINQAESSEYDVVCSCMFDCKALCARYPEARKHFKGNNFEFTDFEARPWDLHGPQNIPAFAVVEGNRGGLHDLTLFKPSVFDAIGYMDVNFYPAYFSDNDYWRRMLLADLKICSVTTAAYFHFWSRTIHQAGESAHTGGAHFRLNEEFYRQKWGGRVGAEQWEAPFNGVGIQWNSNGKSCQLPTTLAIRDRSDEPDIIKYWVQRGINERILL
jgi:GT2 family glycosyltransferase